MKKVALLLLVGVLAACDLQPRITSLPDTVGDFISARYPALLADPDTQPEIYNSAATDYGVYAAPQLPTTGGATVNDYVMYASVNDYTMPTAAPETVTVDEVTPESDDVISVPEYGTPPATTDAVSVVSGVADGEITIAPGDTLYSIARKNNTTVEEIARVNNLDIPYTLTVGAKLKLPDKNESAAEDTSPLVVPQRTAPSRVALRTITVVAGDTLYSLSRKYAVPVNDLAVMNNLTAPFALSVGQTLRVPDLESARGVIMPMSQPKQVSQTGTTPVGVAKPDITTAAKPAGTAPVKQTPVKISSDPNKKLPTIVARAGSKFAWPVRGRVLSHYGAKTGGLFNDGINIAAARGTTVAAAENGVVAYAGNEVKGMGNLVIIQHSGGWMTVYAHMDSMNVRRGARVSMGQKIGTVGSTGKVDAPQLHFEIRKGTKAYNPASYLQK